MVTRLHPISWTALAIGMALLAGCADMDSFLFNTEPLDRYHPPQRLDSLLEPLTLRSGGETIYGYRLRSNGHRPGLTVLYLHGNKENMDQYWDRVEYLGRLGASVVTIDYRGFGMSTGESSEPGLKEDAEAALAWIRANGVPDDSVVVYGFSLGCYPAIHLAGTRLQPRAVIVESPFASATALVQGGAIFDFQRGWLTDGTFDNVSGIGRVTAPVLLMHGLSDDFVRYRDNGRVVFEAANEPKRLIPVPGAVHDNVPQSIGIDEYVRILSDWIDQQ